MLLKSDKRGANGQSSDRLVRCSCHALRAYGLLDMPVFVPVAVAFAGARNQKVPVCGRNRRGCAEASVGMGMSERTEIPAETDAWRCTVWNAKAN